MDEEARGVGVCRHCTGLWLSKETLASGARLPGYLEGNTSANASSRTKRVCPQCSDLLEPQTVLGVVIDVCGTCEGIWIDAGEYLAARRYMIDKRLSRDMPSMREPSIFEDLLETLVEIAMDFRGSNDDDIDVTDIIPPNR